MPQPITIDERELTVTPFFKYETVENVPQSEAAGHPVMETRELVEVRMAGNKHYSPVFRADDFYKREGNRIITYAERWADQYRAFKEGSAQDAIGTPLEMLKAHGIKPSEISLCRALKIYSVESLHALEGPALKSLGMKANELKDAARSYIAAQRGNVDSLSEVEALKKRIAELEAAGTKVSVPEQETAGEVIDEMVAEADAEFADMSDDKIKEEIAVLAGSKPRGNPSRATLVNSLRELREAKAA